MKSVNERLQEAAIRHGIDLSRYSESVVLRMIAVLNRADRNLHEALLKALANINPSTFQMERLEGMLTSVRAINSEAYATVGRLMNEELRDFAEYEVGYQMQTLVRIMPVQVSFATVSVDQVYAAAMARPFQGALLREFFKDQDAHKARLVRRAIAQGFAENQTTQQIVRSIIGTKAKGYRDGLLEVTRREAQAVVRTALSHTALTVKEKFVEANLDLIKALKWSATLDPRTTSPCRARDGKLYEPVTHKPIDHVFPWGGGPGAYHWNCRSVEISITKSFKELGIDVPEFMGVGTRASMDGQVPADMTYPEWLKTKSAALQNEILGPTRGELFRKGGMTLDEMYSAKGEPLTLAELRIKDAAAFKKAGL